MSELAIKLKALVRELSSPRCARAKVNRVLREWTSQTLANSETIIAALEAQAAHETQSGEVELIQVKRKDGKR